MSFPQFYFSENENALEFRNKFKQDTETNTNIKIDNCSGLVKTIFFSNENIELINKQLIISVYNNSDFKFKISEQSKQSLLIVMEYVFLYYSQNLPNDIKQQIKTLNCRVINEILPKILAELNQRVDYIKEINTSKKLLPLPINTKSSKTLQSISTILF